MNRKAALDAVTDTDAGADANARSVTHVFPRIAETGTTRDVLSLFRPRFLDLPARTTANSRDHDGTALSAAGTLASIP